MFTLLRLLLPILAFLQIPILFADQVNLKNGDRISGTIVKFDGKNLVLKSEFAGDVTIPWTAVTGITSTTPLNVGLKSGQMVVGTVQGSESTIDVATKETGTVSAPRDTVVSIRSPEEQAAYDAQIERYRNPRLVDLWTGFLDLGFAQSAGNAETKTFNLSASAARTTTRDKISAYFTSIYSKGQVQGTGLSGATANAKRGGIGYNLNIRKKWFAFGSVGLESDEFQSLDLRFVPAGGLGYHAIAREMTTLDLQVGGALNREFFSVPINPSLGPDSPRDRTTGEALLGDVFMHKFTRLSAVQEKFFFYPGFSGGNRINFDITFLTAVRKWLNWQISFSDRYLSQPVQGRKSNDTLFTTGARLTFAK